MQHSDFMPASRPLIPDARSCADWLARAPLTDSQQACHHFLALLDDLEDAPPRQAEYLRILDCLRDPIRIAQEGLAKKYCAKLLPLSHTESAAFRQACDLWLVLVRAYRRLLRAALKDKRAELSSSVALLCQRSIENTGALITTYLLARREVDEDLWCWLHQMMATAESGGFAETPLSEGESPLSPATSCLAAYSRPLLLHLAAPCGMRERELQWARRWIQRWTPKVRLIRECPERGGNAVDLSGAKGAAWVAPEAARESLRILDLSEVSHSIRRRLRKLEAGAEPSELGLGKDCVQPMAAELLKALLKAWDEPPHTRQYPRRAVSTLTELVSGIPEIYRSMGGEPVVREARPWDYSRHDAEQIHIFQRALGHAARQRVEATAAESWEALDESANGFRLRRRVPGARLAHRQLIALRPQGARMFILAELRWLSQGPEGMLTIGARALPGIAQPCSVRPLAGGSAGEERKEAFVEAFLLPVAEGLPPSLVIPVGRYQGDRVLELRRGNGYIRVKLLGLLGRGHDYDRVNFSLIT